MRATIGPLLAIALTSGVALGAPPPEPVPPRPVGGPIGAEGPIVVEGWDPARRWVAICQAREDTDGDGEIGVMVGYHGDTYGDELTPYLVVGDGPGRRVDGFVGSTGDGRWVALLERGRLILWDSRTGQRLDLTTRGAVSSAASHALFSGYGGFAWWSHRFLFFRDEPLSRAARRRGVRPQRRAVVIDADSGGEQIIDHGADRLFSAYLFEGGRHAMVFTYPEGRDLLLPRTSLAAGGCRGPVTSYSTGGASNLEARFVRVAGPAWRGPRPLVVYDGRALVRDDDGALAWDVAGRRTRALPAGVDGRLLAAARDGAFILAVPAGEGRSEVRWYGPTGTEVATGWRMPTPDQDYPIGVDGVWSRWAEDGLTWLLDSATGAHMTAPNESDLEGSAGARAFLMRRSDGWAAIADVAAGTVVDLPITTSPYATHGYVGSWAFARLDGGGNVVVDVARGRIAGFVGGPEALGLTEDGLLLTPTPRPGLHVSNVLPLGPLRWYAPGALADGP